MSCQQSNTKEQVARGHHRPRPESSANAFLYLPIYAQWPRVAPHGAIRLHAEPAKGRHTRTVGWAIVTEGQNAFVNRLESRALQQHGWPQASVSCINGEITHLAACSGARTHPHRTWKQRCDASDSPGGCVAGEPRPCSTIGILMVNPPKAAPMRNRRQICLQKPDQVFLIRV